MEAEVFPSINTVTEALQAINNQTYGLDVSEKPLMLNHWIGNGHTSDPSEHDQVKRAGLKPKTCRPWMSRLLAGRPAEGIWFWSQGQQPSSNWMWDPMLVSVRVVDLDKTKLFAFPAQAAALAFELWVLGASYGQEELDKDEYRLWMEVLPQVEAVNYDEYTGKFLAEWIYIGDIAPGDIQVVNDDAKG